MAKRRPWARRIALGTVVSLAATRPLHASMLHGPEVGLDSAWLWGAAIATLVAIYVVQRVFGRHALMLVPVAVFFAGTEALWVYRAEELREVWYLGGDRLYGSLAAAGWSAALLERSEALALTAGLLLGTGLLACRPGPRVRSGRLARQFVTGLLAAGAAAALGLWGLAHATGEPYGVLWAPIAVAGLTGIALLWGAAEEHGEQRYVVGLSAVLATAATLAALQRGVLGTVFGMFAAVAVRVDTEGARAASDIAWIADHAGPALLVVTLMAALCVVGLRRPRLSTLAATLVATVIAGSAAGWRGVATADVERAMYPGQAVAAHVTDDLPVAVDRNGEFAGTWMLTMLPLGDPCLVRPDAGGAWTGWRDGATAPVATGDVFASLPGDDIPPVVAAPCAAPAPLDLPRREGEPLVLFVPADADASALASTRWYDAERPLYLALSHGVSDGTLGRWPALTIDWSPRDRPVSHWERLLKLGVDGAEPGDVTGKRVRLLPEPGVTIQQLVDACVQAEHSGATGCAVSARPPGS